MLLSTHLDLLHSTLHLHLGLLPLPPELGVKLGLQPFLLQIVEVLSDRVLLNLGGGLG